MPGMGPCRKIAWTAARGALVLAAATLFSAPATSAASASPIALGVNIAQVPDQSQPLTDYDTLAGRPPAILMWYQEWSEPLYWSAQSANMANISAVPMITWDPMMNGVGIPLSQITSGAYDSVIRAAAQAAVAFKRLMYIRLGHEMNLSGSPFGSGSNGNTAAGFVAAWKHVVTIFRQQGATNVEWVWSPNTDCAGKCPFTSYYPGDAWVDWVALDGYNYGPVDNVPWMSFDQIFGSSYKTITAMTQKPLMIAETASTELGGNKAQWITQSFNALPSKYPRVRAVVWFDRNKETDWRVNSSSASLSAWRQVVSSSAFGGTPAWLAALVPTARDVTAQTSASVTVPSRRARLARAHRHRHHQRHHHRRHHRGRRHQRRR